MVVHDGRRSGKLHPATLAASALVAASLGALFLLLASGAGHAAIERLRLL